MGLTDDMIDEMAADFVADCLQDIGDVAQDGQIITRACMVKALRRAAEILETS